MIVRAPERFHVYPLRARDRMMILFVVVVVVVVVTRVVPMATENKPVFGLVR